MGIDMIEMVLVKVFFAVVIFITIFVGVTGFSNKSAVEREKKRFADTAPKQEKDEPKD